MKIEWKGVMPAVTTKFTEEDTIDRALFAKNVQAQLDAGVNGIVLGGTLGEASTLTEQEKTELIKICLPLTGKNIPVILNIAEQSTKSAIRAAQKAETDGASGIMVLPPMRYKATDQEVLHYFSAIAENTSLPMMIYNNPVDYKIEVTLDMFETLLKHDNIQAVKESTRDITNVTRIKNRFGNRLKIMAGVDTLALESIIMGADGWVAGLVDAFPRETVAIFKLAQAGRIAEAINIYRWFMPLLELDISPQLVQNIKLAEMLTGLGSEKVREPRIKLSGHERERVMNIIQTQLKTRPVLPAYLSLRESEQVNLVN